MTPYVPPIAHIIERIASQFGMTAEDLRGYEREEPVVSVRKLAMYVAKAVTRQTYEQIGRAFGGRHHTTVISNIRQVRDKTYDGAWTKRAAEKLVEQLATELGVCPQPVCIKREKMAVQPSLNGACSTAAEAGTPLA